MDTYDGVIIDIRYEQLSYHFSKKLTPKNNPTVNTERLSDNYFSKFGEGLTFGFLGLKVPYGFKGIKMIRTT